MTKDCHINLRCDEEQKKVIENMASARGLSVSELIFKLIQSGAAEERKRREELHRQFLSVVRANENEVAA